MTFSWESAPIINTQQKSTEEKDNGFSWESSPVIETESKSKSFFRSTVQPFLGFLKKSPISWGADAIQALGVGDALAEIEELSEKYPNFNRQKALQSLAEAVELFPTQENIEKGIEASTGLPLRPEGTADELLRLGGTGAGFAKGSLSQRAVAGALAAGTSGTARASGAPETAADILGLGVSSLKGGATNATKPLSQEAAQLEKIAETHNLRKFQGMFEEKPPSFKPVVSEKTLEKAKKALTESSQKAIDKIIDKKIPISQAIKEGNSAKDLYKAAYDKAYQKADEVVRPVNMRDFIEWSDKKIKSIESSAPSLGANEEKLIDLIRKEREVFTNNPLQPSVNLLNQYRNYNERMSGIYRKPEFSGYEDKVKNLHREFNDQIINAIEKSGEKEVSEPFKLANKLYNEDQKLQRVYKILEPALEDTSKLDKILSSKKGEFIKRDLGKDAYQDIKDISNYSKKAEEKIFDQVKIKPSLVDSFKDWGKIFGVLSPYLILGPKGGAASAIGIGAKEGIGRLRGQLFLKDSSRKSYKNLMRVLSTGSESAIKKAAQDLDESVEKEWGSLENFFKSIEEDED